ncbi:hypothetical protein [Pararhizobium sp. A13]|uniref:hypothetical protein n=1 Tax=Pararhizobium sp. A13 TaxID=3133975 RepID=UPI00324C3D5C
MRLIALMLCGSMLAAAPALAQETAPDTGDPSISGSSGSGIGRLLGQGYEIRAAVPNGTRYIVFLQKDQSAYACEFVSLTKSRCGSIN